MTAAKRISMLLLIPAIVAVSAEVSDAGHRWVRSFGTQYQVSSVCQNADGSFTVAGRTTGNDLWCAKLDASGEIVWQQAYGNAASEWAFAVQPMADGGNIAAGWTTTGGITRAWCLRLGASGNILWQKAYGNSSLTTPNMIRPTADGGAVLIGYVRTTFGDNDILVVKLDLSGNIVWQKQIGWAGNDSGADIWQTSDGGYVAVGQVGTALLVIRLDATGNVLWMRSYGGYWTSGGSIRQTSDGGYVVAARVSGSGLDDAWCIKLDPSGNVAWQRAYGGPGPEALRLRVQQTSDGGYSLFGDTASFGSGSNDLWLVKLDQDGNVSWSNAYGTSAPEVFHSGEQTSEGGFVMSGWAYGGLMSGSFVVRTTTDGTIDAGCGTFVQPCAPTVTNTSASNVLQSGAQNSTYPAVTTVAGASTTAAVSNLYCSLSEGADFTGAWSNLRKRGSRISGKFSVVNTGNINGENCVVKVYSSKTQQVGRKAKPVKTQNVPTLGMDKTYRFNVRAIPGSKDKYIIAVIEHSKDVDMSDNKIAASLP
ncbi:MAG: hypothetical protein AB1714_23130 [Acidobacteriota bacterium]